MSTARPRSTAEVLDDHLRESQMGSVETDLARNYATDLIVLTRCGVFRGHDGLRRLAQRLREELPNASFEYRTQVVEGELGFLEWTARAEGSVVDDGADSYLIREERIVGQTIHYTVRSLCG